MEWEAVGAIGEIIGAFAVVLSLLYLAIQIRQTRINEMQTQLRDSYDSYDEVRKSIYENEDVAQVFMLGISQPDAMTPVEEVRFLGILERMFLNGERYWRLAGTDDDWRMQTIVPFLASYLDTPGGQYFWDHPLSDNLDTEFRELIAKAERPAQSANVALAERARAN